MTNIFKTMTISEIKKWLREYESAPLTYQISNKVNYILALYELQQRKGDQDDRV